MCSLFPVGGPCSTLCMRHSVLELVWDEEVVDKLWRKHRVETWEVEEVVFDDEGAEFRWSCSRQHGRRLLVRGRTAGVGGC